MTITPGTGPTVDGGAPPGLRVLAPSPAEDRLAADAASWIVAWLAATGVDVTLREGKPRTTDADSFDVAVLTTETTAPAAPFLAIEPGLARSHLRAGTIEAALVAWAFAGDRILEEALAVPLLRTTTGGTISDRIVLPYTPLAGLIDPASMAGAVRRA